MSFNLDRRVRRDQMKEAIKEFKKENKVSTKQLDAQLFTAARLMVRRSLSMRFARMIELATKAYEEGK